MNCCMLETHMQVLKTSFDWLKFKFIIEGQG